jgi:uncharacterized protein (TIGR01777 family)
VKIIIAGGSGFLGTALTRALANDGHDVVVLTRSTGGSGLGRRVQWSPEDESGGWTREIDGAGAVINLAGAGIADKRWSEARRHTLVDSRLIATRSLVAAVGAATRRPPVFVSGSAVGFYGTSETETFVETSSQGSDFLARLCINWESEATQAQTHGCRVVLIRTGIVLSRNGGALKKMLLPFRLGLGGPIASGRQVMSWIHVDDWVNLVRWTISTETVRGPVNATAPAPVTNSEFTRALGRALHRPVFMPMPAFIIRLMFGAMADVALIRGQRVAPRKAVDNGFSFTYGTIDAAMAAALASHS